MGAVLLCSKIRRVHSDAARRLFWTAGFGGDMPKPHFSETTGNRALSFVMVKDAITPSEGGRRGVDWSPWLRVARWSVYTALTSRGGNRRSILPRPRPPFPPPTGGSSPLRDRGRHGVRRCPDRHHRWLAGGRSLPGRFPFVARYPELKPPPGRSRKCRSQAIAATPLPASAPLEGLRSARFRDGFWARFHAGTNPNALA